MTAGWVKNWRQIKDWRWYKVDGMAHLFQHLIREANHETQEWQGETINRGQVICGRKTLSYETGLSEQTIRTCIERLKSTSEITVKSTNRFSVITINSYDTYQNQIDASNQQINQPTHNQVTSNQPAINQQVTTNKNDKNENNDKNEKKYNKFTKPSIEELETYSKEIKFSLDCKQFFDYYESKGWLVGKSPMKDWKAAVRTWQRNGYKNGKSSGNNRTGLGTQESRFGIVVSNEC